MKSLTYYYFCSFLLLVAVLGLVEGGLWGGGGRGRRALDGLRSEEEDMAFDLQGSFDAEQMLKACYTKEETYIIDSASFLPQLPEGWELVKPRYLKDSPITLDSDVWIYIEVRVENEAFDFNKQTLFPDCRWTKANPGWSARCLIYPADVQEAMLYMLFHGSLAQKRQDSQREKRAAVGLAASGRVAEVFPGFTQAFANAFKPGVTLTVEGSQIGQIEESSFQAAEPVSGGNGLDGGEIAGIVIGSIAGFGILLAVIVAATVAVARKIKTDEEVSSKQSVRL